MYASGSAPGRNFCSIGLSSRQNSLFAMVPPQHQRPPRHLATASRAISDCPSRHSRPSRVVLRPRARISPGARACRPPVRHLTLVSVIPLPEPDLTPQTLIERARALIPAVRAQQEEAERLGHHTAELGRQFTEAGFYRILQPRQFGGYAFGLPTFWRVMLAISSGDPGTGWALTLGAHHVLTIGAWFSEAGQHDIFGSSGEFAAPHRALPSGTAEPAGGGYLVSGTWDYCSGSAHATHFMCNAMVAGTTDRITAVMPMDQVTVLDDWGDGIILGMNSSGSNSVASRRCSCPRPAPRRRLDPRRDHGPRRRPARPAVLRPDLRPVPRRPGHPGDRRRPGRAGGVRADNKVQADLLPAPGTQVHPPGLPADLRPRAGAHRRGRGHRAAGRGPLHGAGRALGGDRGAVHPRGRRPAVRDDPAGRPASRAGRAGGLRRLVFLGGQARHAAAALLPRRGHVPRSHRLAVPDHSGRPGPRPLRPPRLALLTRRQPPRGASHGHVTPATCQPAPPAPLAGQPNKTSAN